MRRDVANNLCTIPTLSPPHLYFLSSCILLSAKQNNKNSIFSEKRLSCHCACCYDSESYRRLGCWGCKNETACLLCSAGEAIGWQKKRGGLQLNVYWSWHMPQPTEAECTGLWSGMQYPSSIKRWRRKAGPVAVILTILF